MSGDGTESVSMRREVAICVALAGLAVAFVAVPPDPERLGPSTPCTTAVLIGGELRCDDEAVLAVQQCDTDALAGDVIEDCRVRARMNADDLELLAIPIDVNTASPEDLASLRGVGPVVAARIVAGRPYASADDLRRVEGIGAKTLQTMRPRVRVHPPRIR
jgi:hypothetical protein